MTRLSPVFLLLLAACSSDPVTACEDYIAADNACATEAYGGTENTQGAVSGIGGGASCDGLYGELKGKEAKTAASAFTCFAETLDGADCSTPQAYFDALDAACDCEDAVPELCTGDPASGT